MSGETRERFRLRTRVVRALRGYLDEHGFEEVETPVLQTVPSGAAARPFLTHHNALDLDVYLRIAPETWLKRLIVGGYDRVYEFARCFRNEGMDPSHLQDFTMLEYYCAYWNWEDNLRFTEKLMKHLVQEVLGSLTIEWRGRTIDFSGEWPRYKMADIVREHANRRALELGLPLLHPTTTVPIRFIGLGPQQASIAMARQLLDHGLLPGCALFPAVAGHQTGIRFTVTRHHELADLDLLLETMADFLPEALAQADVSRADVDRAFELKPAAASAGEQHPR